jgi:hypothetical protein
VDSALLPNIRQTAFQFRTQIGAFACDLNGLASRFTSQPEVQFLRQGMHAPTLVGDGHSRFCPSLGYGYWLTQKRCDLLPAVQRVRFISRVFGSFGMEDAWRFDVHSDFRAANQILYTLPEFHKPSDQDSMITDTRPRKANQRAGFLESDRTKTLELPQDGRWLIISRSIESAMKSGTTADVRRTCAEFLDAASEFYEVSACGIRVLAARPLRVREHWSSELFGDYTPETMMIRVWKKTAVRREVTSFGTFLSTLCHEFCHHLDFQRFGFHDSWHTRGFYDRAAALYHHAKGTPPKKLFWLPTSGGRWRIDWPRTNRGV